MRVLIVAMALLAVTVCSHELRAAPPAAEAAPPQPEGEAPLTDRLRRPRSGGVEFVVGNDLWQPGKRYRGADDWLALACSKAGCSFEPAQLAVKPEKWQGHYDDKPNAGQRLIFKRMATPSSTLATASKVIGWFHPDAKRPWLKPGPVTTYASSAAPRMKPPTQGTLETAVVLPDGSHAVFVPLLDRARPVVYLQLRAQGWRQLLGQLSECSREVAANYLLWAGDMDGDGRPDYLVSFLDENEQTLLYLSSASASNELAGVAGIYDASPSDGECDGDGWLQR